MDIGLLAEARQRNVDALDNQILQAQAEKARQEEIRDKLQGMMSQGSFSIDDINFLIEVSQ